jgi:hypothetical protein
MSEEPREYHVHFDASDELDKQTERARLILERLAAHLAATAPQRDPQFKDLVEREHVQQAAELVLGSRATSEAQLVSPARAVFVSFSHEDEAFVGELTKKLTEAGITHYKADRDIRPATDWGEAIWEAIRSCRVFLCILTPRFIKSRWRDLEGGAACASNKQVLTVLRYVERSDVQPPFDRFQSVIVENAKQLDGLIVTLKQMCDET